ncbi:MAG: transglycosylase domain-containing protein [Deltaproteobacteria bacterium]|nr:transglycosylase domain-containing protein [Deltaproteobacteria bacterium]
MSGRAVLRRVLVAGAIVLLLAIAAIGVRIALPDLVRAHLSDRGCTVEAVIASGLGWEATGLVCPGLEARSVHGSLLNRAVRMAEVVCDASTWARREGSAGPGGSRRVRTVRVDGLEVRAGSLVLARNLAGHLVPLDLSGPGVIVRADGEAVHLEIERQLSGPPVAGRIQAEARWDLGTGRVEGHAAADPDDGLTVTWRLLGSTPLQGLVARTTVRGRVQGPTDLEGLFGWPGVSIPWTVREKEGGVLEFEAVLPDTDLAAVLGPLARLAPEVDRARVHGTVGGRLAWRRGGRPEATLRLDVRSVEGALPPAHGLDRGPFTWRCRSARGEIVPCHSGEGTPGWIPLEAVSPHLVHAVLAAEDASFYAHRGYDPKALEEALDADLAALRVVRGGSTLTQQLAKNLFLDGEQTLARKVRELLLAVEMDRALGKQRVLELYLNVVEWGPGIHGLGAACQRTFLKDPSRLDPLEAAFLAALLPAPRAGYRRAYLEGGPDRRRLAGILDAMVQAGWLHPEEAVVWKAAPLRLVPPPETVTLR